MTTELPIITFSRDADHDTVAGVLSHLQFFTVEVFLSDQDSIVGEIASTWVEGDTYLEIRDQEPGENGECEITTSVEIDKITEVRIQ